MPRTFRGRGGELKGERDRFVAFSFAAADLLLEVDCEGRIRFASGAARVITGKSAESLVGTSFDAIFSSDDRLFINVLLKELETGSRLEPVIVRLLGVEGRTTAAVLGGCRLANHPESIFVTFSAPRHAPLINNRRLARESASGLLGREGFAQIAAEMFRQRMLPAGRTKLSLVQLFGMDDLRARAGEEASAAFLRETGAYLRAVSFNGDSAGQLTDERFGVIHTTAFNPEKLTSRVADFARKADPSGQGVRVARSSVDLALEAMTEEDAARAIAYTIEKFADYPSGSFPLIESLSDAFRSLLRDTVARIGAFKGTVAESRFDVAFQPIVDLATRTVQHHEMLARLEGGKSPYALVTFAEGVGMIEEFDLAICQRAIEFLQDKSSGATPIAVNLSGRSLESMLFAETLLALLKPHAAIASRLYFELTESTQVNALEQVNGVIQALRNKGHRFALDDFGAGASSYPYLHALTVDFVKIDGAYVQRVLADGRDAAILRSIVTLCRELGVRTIAEMVETEAQADELKAIGVDFAQGYLFGRPAPRPIAIVRTAPRNVAQPLLRQGSQRAWS
ncbi:MAG TPA: EAL domain-containing protein [Alphaproteobacteria bacterium]